MNITALDFPECGNAVFNAVYGKICISGCILCHRLEDASRCRKEACAAMLGFVHIGFKLDMLGLQPSR